MKLSDYYSIKRQEYVTFKLIPTKSSRNNTTIGIAHLINSMYRSTNKLIYKENKKLINGELNKLLPQKSSFEIWNVFKI